ncbi:MAG: 4-hydroxy-tetrahydrodipicolinate synthase [Acidobacteria bacterium]|nr:MAG: 4-hydroxy-tetrahydrodipicolinate synthase [Acidobacteriota bacterium]
MRGVFTALVTPFREGGAVDEEAFVRLVDRQLEAGVHGLVPCGTTGEAPALEQEEWERLVAVTVERAKGRVPVVAGTGTNNTALTIARTRRARELGADAALVVTPYYNKPNPAGLLAHYRAVAEEGGLPIVFYNVPSRTGLNATPEILRPIAEIELVRAVKEASGSLSQAHTLIKERPGGVAVLSGEDELTCAMTLMGGDGVVSVVSNVDPAGTVRMVEAALAGDAEAARREHERLLDLMRALFAETNPVPAKAALAALGLCADAVRPPLAPASPATRSRLEKALRAAGLLGPER